MQTSDPGHLFQTTAQLRQAASRERKLKAAEKIGSPITLSSKVLGLEIRGNDAFTAESGWQARRIDLKTGKTTRLYRGHQGPVTSLAFMKTQGENPADILLTGSWDKTIRVWDADTGAHLQTLEGHTDFIKSVTVIHSSPPLLLSTSSDRTCRLWDLSETLKDNGNARSSQILKEHTRPVECAAWKADVDEDGKPMETITVWTGDSLGVIKKWKVEQGKLVYQDDIPGHETSVAKLIVAEEGLWSVSMDKTAILHPFADASAFTIPHNSYVKSILPLTSFALPNAHSLVLTGSEDEDIRVWDIESQPPKLKGTIQGHCAEVSDIKPYLRERDGKPELVVVSAGLDATLRTWTVQDVLNPPELVYDEPEEKNAVGLTEEEERELAELMSEEES
ncbi:cytoplasmic protein [Cryptococcus deuterogattii 99/473]|uniref:Cytoplasmic protein n=1 Tax=Cryptococcus deuterogattii Ram5 TaxID=1296110 RepID=A0A0D0V8C4_9TREE|nr:cytoplasmic protein [Cryptococcus deuterogattii Ram5]KIY60407.1 cytoplasmic protein [Cryptococcus deuterogattii 99/473]